MKNFLKSQIIAILMTWFMLYAYILFGGGLFSKNFKIFFFVYNWIPGLIAFYFIKKEKLQLHFFKDPFKKVDLALTLALSIVFLGSFFSFPFCEMRSFQQLKELLPPFLHNLSLMKMLSMFVLIWIVIGTLFVSLFHFFIICGREIMFFGYGWEKLKVLGFWKASWLLGLYRGLWFSPLILIGMYYPGAPLLGVPLGILCSILLAPFQVYLRIISKNILCPALFLGFLLHFSNFFLYFFKTKSIFLFSTYGATGLVAVLFLNLILFLKIRRIPLLEYELT